MIRSLLLGAAILITVSLTGCLTVGGGITERAFDAGWDGLELGETTAGIERMFGPPREKQPDPDGAVGRITWIYSRPEVIGHRTEIDEVILNRSGASVPTYERVEVFGNVEFHFHFQDDELVEWERIVPRARTI